MRFGLAADGPAADGPAADRPFRKANGKREDESDFHFK